jgi:hypothetical protein
MSFGRSKGGVGGRNGRVERCVHDFDGETQGRDNTGRSDPRWDRAWLRIGTSGGIL